MAPIKMHALVPLTEGAQRPRKGECFNVASEQRAEIYEAAKMAERCKCNGACDTVAKAAGKPVELGKKKSEEFSKTTDPSLLWTNKMPPEEYLEKYPEGPRAELARKIVASKDGAGAEKTEENNDQTSSKAEE